MIAGCLLGGGFCWSLKMLHEKEQERGFKFAAAVSALLAASMGSRFARTRRVMPAGLLAAAGAASAAYHLQQWSEC